MLADGPVRPPDLGLPVTLAGPDWTGAPERVLHDRDGRLVALRPPAPDRVPLAPREPLTDGVVVLRAPRASDLPRWAEFGADEDVLRWTPVPRGLDAADLTWALEPGAGHLVIADAGDDAFLGACDARTGDGGAELGYALLEAGRGRGLATRAIALLTEWLLRDVPRVNAYVDPANPRSARVLERAGFVREGFLKDWRGPRGDRDAWSRLA